MVKYLFILLSFAFAAVTVGTNGNYHFTTIQEAIDSVTFNPIDTEINVYPGTYQENLLIESDMVILSMGDATNTIIDGSLGRGLGSTVVIRPGSGSPSKPDVEIDGFKITGGKGTDIKNKTITLPDGTHPIEKVGGGIFVYVNSPKINYCQIIENGSLDVDKGGGVFAISDKEDSDFSTRDDYVDSNELTPANSVLYLSNNVFLDNQSQEVKTLYVLGEGDYSLITMEDDSLDVFSSVYENVSEYWVQSQYDIDYEGALGDLEAILTDVWVDPLNGMDEGNVVGDSLNPFLTINYAMGMIYPTEDNPITIHLLDGTYSLSNNGEIYPINFPRYVNLIGRGETAENVILNGEQSVTSIIHGVWHGFNELSSTMISNLTITGATISEGTPFSTQMYFAISIANGSTLNNAIYLDRVIIHDNAGGGIYLGTVNAVLSNVTIVNNQGRGADLWIGYPNNYNIYVYNSIIWNNLLATANGTVEDGSNICSNGNIIINYSTIDIRYDTGVAGQCWESGECYTNNNYLCDGYGPQMCYEAEEQFFCSFLNSEEFSLFVDVFGEPACEWVSDSWCTEDEFACEEMEGFCIPFEWVNDGYDDCPNGSDEGPVDDGNIIDGFCAPSPIFMDMGEGISIYDCLSAPIEDCGFSNDFWFCETHYYDCLSPEYGEITIHNDPLFENGSYRLTPNSPCIDTGTEILEYNDDTFIIPENNYCGEHPDMGALEYITEECEESVFSGDLNGDGDLNIMDVVALVNIVLGNADPIDSGDLNGDENINIMDVVALVNIILEV